MYAERKNLSIGFIFICIVLFFSGIGSYTFQNYDHLYRNAIFRDLVLKPWPVLYHVKGFGNHIFEGKTTVMTYYMGYFLPAALIGKILGFEVGKFALLLWSVLGTFLVYLQVCRYFQKYNLKSLVLFLGWGTLFYIGSIYKYPITDILKEKNWLWAGMILYADSNIGLIYYTFNQSLTAWLILLLIIQNIMPRQIIFWYCMSFFLSPFAFIGMAPFALYSFLTEVSLPKIKNYFSFENVIGGFAVLGLTYVYLSSNQAGQFFQVLHHKPKIILVFLALSWGIVAVLLLKDNFKNKLFWLSVLVLLPLPFFQQGYGIDFPGRLSIPALFILMLLVGKTIIETKSKWVKVGLITYMMATAIPHFFLEPLRSLYYTAIEYTAYNTTYKPDRNSNSSLERYVANDILESKQQTICIKDLGTLTNPKNEVIWNYMSDTEKSNFYKWLAKKPNIKQRGN
jgi:hypothetical protein